jgi:hypothetical protein
LKRIDLSPLKGRFPHQSERNASDLPEQLFCVFSDGNTIAPESPLATKLVLLCTISCLHDHSATAPVLGRRGELVHGSTEPDCRDTDAYPFSEPHFLLVLMPPYWIVRLTAPELVT